MPSSSPGQRLRTGRLKLNKKQAQVAHEIHKANSTYKSWEQNRARPKTFQDIINVCQAVGISIDYYISGEECQAQLTPTEERALNALSQLTENSKMAIVELIEKLSKEGGNSNQ